MVSGNSRAAQLRTGECVKMYKEAIRAAWAEINVSNLDFNIKSIREKVGPDKKITGVIKADGYGHGAVKVANVLTANGINSFAVATLSEAVRLREAGFTAEEIVVLGLTPDPYVDTIVDYGLTPVVCTYSNAEAISKCCAEGRQSRKGPDRGGYRHGQDRLQPGRYDVHRRCEE